MSSSPWQADPALAGRFHAQHPNDLQVIVHDGEPRRTKLPPEACWVTVNAVHGALRMPMASGDVKPPLTAEQVSWVERPVYAGTLLNEPKGLKTVRRGDTILLVHSPGLPFPVRVTEAYLAERQGWFVKPCDKCGADQSLDPMTVMARTRFPDAPPGAILEMFTAFCGCGGTMVLTMLHGAPPPPRANGNGNGGSEKKPWWKFW